MTVVRDLPAYTFAVAFFSIFGWGVMKVIWRGLFSLETRLVDRHHRMVLKRATSYVNAGLSLESAKQRACEDLEREARAIIYTQKGHLR